VILGPNLGRILAGTRQIDRYPGAPSDFAVDRDRAAGLMSEPIDLRQAKSSSFVDSLGRKERVEDAREDILWNSKAGIRYGNGDEVPRQVARGLPARQPRVFN
jgi:hypothetical protein